MEEKIPIPFAIHVGRRSGKFEGTGYYQDAMRDAMRDGLTKRQLGLLLILLGGGAVVALLAVDLLGAGRFQGIGPAQRLGLGAALLVIVVGLSLLPLGDRPA